MNLVCSRSNVRCKYKNTILCLVCGGMIDDKDNRPEDNSELSTEEQLNDVKQRMRELEVVKIQLEKKLKQEKKEARRKRAE